MSEGIKSSTTKKSEVGGLEYALKRIFFFSFNSMHPKKVKTLLKHKRERSIYIVSVLANPVLLYFLTHNKYFCMKLNIKLYAVAALFGYFFEKGTVLAFKENRDKVSNSKNYSLVNRHVVNKHEKQLCDVLTSLNIPHTIAKTNTNEFATQIYVLSNIPIKTILNNEREIAKRMNLENKNLTISVERSYFMFDIRNSSKKAYFFDEYIKGVTEKQLKEKELPFILGIQQSTGKLIIEDLENLQSSLVAGARGNGKSCFANNLIQSLMTLSKTDVISVMADFKGNERVKRS